MHGPIIDHQNVDATKPRQQTAKAAISTRHRQVREIAIGRVCREASNRLGTPSEPEQTPRSSCPHPLARARTRFRAHWCRNRPGSAPSMTISAFR